MRRRRRRRGWPAAQLAEPISRAVLEGVVFPTCAGRAIDGPEGQ